LIGKKEILRFKGKKPACVGSEKRGACCLGKSPLSGKKRGLAIVRGEGCEMDWQLGGKRGMGAWAWERKIPGFPEGLP